MVVPIPTDKQVEAMAAEHKKLALERFTLHKVGLVLRYLGIGLTGGMLLRVFYFHDKITWHHWFPFSVGVLVLIITGVIIPYNRKYMIAHATAHDGMMGILNSQPRSSQRILHLDQAQAALDHLVALHEQSIGRLRRFKLFRKKS